MKPVVILSPHLDDAVFSCWHALHIPNVIVITIFAGIPGNTSKTLWDRICGEPSSAKMMSRRLRENEAVFCDLQVTSYTFEYLDRQYSSKFVDVQEVAKSVLAKVSVEALYLAPLAGSLLWRHPNHIFVREVGKLLATQGNEVAFYADIPYMQMPLRSSAEYKKQMARRGSKYLGSPTEVEIIELSLEDQALKHNAMRQYRTQYKMTNLACFGALGRKANVQREVVFHGAS